MQTAIVRARCRTRLFWLASAGWLALGFPDAAAPRELFPTAVGSGEVCASELAPEMAEVHTWASQHSEELQALDGLQLLSLGELPMQEFWSFSITHAIEVVSRAYELSASKATSLLEAEMLSWPLRIGGKDAPGDPEDLLLAIERKLELAVLRSIEDDRAVELWLGLYQLTYFRSEDPFGVRFRLREFIVDLFAAGRYEQIWNHAGKSWRDRELVVRLLELEPGSVEVLAHLVTETFDVSWRLALREYVASQASTAEGRLGFASDAQLFRQIRSFAAFGLSGEIVDLWQSLEEADRARLVEAAVREEALRRYEEPYFGSVTVGWIVYLVSGALILEDELDSARAILDRLPAPPPLTRAELPDLFFRAEEGPLREIADRVIDGTHKTPRQRRQEFLRMALDPPSLDAVEDAARQLGWVDHTFSGALWDILVARSAGVVGADALRRRHLQKAGDWIDRMSGTINRQDDLFVLLQERHLLPTSLRKIRSRIVTGIREAQRQGTSESSIE